MKRLALATLLVLPLAAAAQTYYHEPPMTRGELRGCVERDQALRDRLTILEQEKRGNDLESGEIAREGAQLAADLRRLDNGDPSAVADYNARSDAHNRWVIDHNNRVAGMNGRASLYNRDAADMGAQCSTRVYYFRDLDYVRRDGTLR